MPIPRGDVWRVDDFGMQLLKEYADRVRQDYDNNPVLKIFKPSGGIVRGSNPFAVVLVDMIVRPNARVATPADLQAILDSLDAAADPPRVQGAYNDAALVLRTVQEPNSYIGQRLRIQAALKLRQGRDLLIGLAKGERPGTSGFPFPAVFPLSGLKLVKDSGSPHGLSFDLTEESRFFTAPVLMEKSGHFDDVDVNRTSGLPEALRGSGRYCYCTDRGLTRLYLGRGGSIDTIWDELDNSQADGCVVLMDNAVAPEKISQYVSYLDHGLDVLAD